ncbi:MAG TPA: hypothetical protein VMV78_10525, partial [Thiobacillus sp.]|nr:hypothetical protein [Thiobacillus sp.]
MPGERTHERRSVHLTGGHPVRHGPHHQFTEMQPGFRKAIEQPFRRQIRQLWRDLPAGRCIPHGLPLTSLDELVVGRNQRGGLGDWLVPR